MKAIAEAYCDFDAPQTITSKNDAIGDTKMMLSGASGF
jgi:hypothetical protein